MELRQLQCLIACAQTQSFSKAALLLFTSQSNVSKTIASLEKELGKKLFDRKQYGIELTEKGKQIYKYAVTMMECSNKIIDCAEEEDLEELRIAFQPSSWFASAFCEYYLQNQDKGVRYRVTSSSVDDIIHRVSSDMDQLGFAYIEEAQLKKMQEIFRSNHLGYYTLKSTKMVLYCGAKKNDDDLTELPLIQGSEDNYSGIGKMKLRLAEEESSRKLKVVVSTNSDYIMQEVLKKTHLSNISPEYVSHEENEIFHETLPLEGDGQNILLICIFRNDSVLEKLPKEYLSFIRSYIKKEN